MSSIKLPPPDLQLSFLSALRELRKSALLEALRECASQIDPEILDREIRRHASPATLKKMARWGLRGELLVMTPTIIKRNPRLISFYRLLYGYSQKEYYKSGGAGKFKGLETRGAISDRQQEELPQLCVAMGRIADQFAAGSELLSLGDVHDLTLITLGPQLRGGKLNELGSDASAEVFSALRQLVKRNLVKEDAGRSLVIKNAAGREIHILFANDPDIRVRELIGPKKFRNVLAVEIKGGRDISNAHNRLGEAEKSHQKARHEGYTQFWTLLKVKLDKVKARKETPTTTRFFDIDEMLNPGSSEHHEFREQFLSLIGLAL